MVDGEEQTILSIFHFSHHDVIHHCSSPTSP